MFSARYILILPLLIAFVHGHAVVSPALGVQGAPVRKDAQRTGANPCGRINVAQNIDSSETISPNADGSITMTINNFNPRLDGSRQIRKASLDTTGSGQFNTPVTVTKNGDPSPDTKTGSEQITVQMPAGVQCTGGASGDLCVMSFTTLSGFGNCVVVKQGGAAGATTGAADTPAAGAGNTAGTAAAAGAGNAAGAGAGKAKGFGGLLGKIGGGKLKRVRRSGFGHI